MHARRHVRQKPADTSGAEGSLNGRAVGFCDVLRAEVVASGMDNSGKKWVVTAQVFPGQDKANLRA